MDIKYWRLASAMSARNKADVATYQTGDGGMKRTIINVDEDEALVICRALEDYIKKHQAEKGETC